VIRNVPGVEKVWTAEAVCKELHQPLDREGDIAVTADLKTVIGSKEAEHDLSALKGHRLRTHGSLHEAKVPLIISNPLKDAYNEKAARMNLGSEDVFDFIINGTA
jgi:phosphonoacetate hydrolase